MSSEVSWQFVSCQNSRYLCVWREQVASEVAFYQQMETLNAFYDAVHAHGGRKPRRQSVDE